MSVWKRIAACLAAAMIGWGGLSAMSESTASSGDWYQQVIRDAQMRLGNNKRLHRLIERAQSGENITVATIGGSITEGAGAAKYQECYAFRVATGFGERYGKDGNVRFVNAGVGGTPSTFGLMRYQREVNDKVQDEDGLADLVIVEFSVNDYGEPTNHQCFESLVKTILTQPNDPVVILLFAVFQNGFNLQDDIRKIGDKYDLMMVSIKDGAYGHIGKEWTAKDFFSDQYHPTSLGHGVMADCVLGAIEAAWQAEENEADIDLNVKAAYGTNYVGLVSVFGSSDLKAIGLDRGGFIHDDRTSYSNLPVGRVCGPNFCHDSKDGSEPLRFTATFKNLLIAYKAANGDQYGAAVVRVDGKVMRTMRGGADKWGQSEVILAYVSPSSKEHTVEISMAEDSLDKRFTITCIAFTP